MEFNEKDLSEFVGSRVREYRKKKGMTQKELGDKIGVKHNTVSNYETGSISPEQDMLFALSRALDISIDDLFPSTKNNEYKSLEHAYQVAETNDLDYEDLMLIKTITDKALELEGDERKKLMDNIKFAVDFFEKNDK